MRTSYILGALLVSILAAESALCDEGKRRENVISEEAMRNASARLYSDILFRTCLNGHRYSRSQIEKGFKRHAGEMKLQLEKQGYRIAPAPAAPSPNSLGMAVAAKPEPSERGGGCFRRYWLDEGVSTAAGEMKPD